MFSKETINKISQGNIRHHQNKLAEFLAADPHCSQCNNPIISFSRTGVCRSCQLKINLKKFKERNPNYWKKNENGKA